MAIELTRLGHGRSIKTREFWPTERSRASLSAEAHPNEILGARKGGELRARCCYHDETRRAPARVIVGPPGWPAVWRHMYMSGD